MNEKNKYDEAAREQIEEMAKAIARADDICRARTVSEALYDEGWRKQSEGEWVKDAPHWRYKCNQCGFFPLMLHGDFLPFCPTCGAKMKGGA